jgi:1-deoxy-D-xylulose-5-phosphate reductoisomerase
MIKYLYIAGACGSIGTQTLDIARKHKEDFKVVGFSVGSNLKLAYELIEEFKPEIVIFRKKEDIRQISYNPYVSYGDEGLLELASYSKYENEVFVNSLVGVSGLNPTAYAIRAKKQICLANKETLVVAGDIIKSLAKEHNVDIIPIDSEHSAILQCLTGEKKEEVKRLIITASGGSFRNKTREELANVTVSDALCHPNWSMGKKITIDSATMMNKGFEVIEAHYLFDLDYDKIDTILHPQSIVHSFVEFNDGTIKAQLGVADMHTPISYALFYPSHKIENERLNLLNLNLNFYELSQERFPCLKYAYEAALKGEMYLCALNASNEAAVYLFLNNYINFLEIEKIIECEINKDEYKNLDYSIESIIKTSEIIIDRILKSYGVIK